MGRRQMILPLNVLKEQNILATLLKHGTFPDIAR